MKKIAVFASGNGSNFQAIIDAIADQTLHARIELLVCDRKGASVLERARESQIEAALFIQGDYASKEAFELDIVALLKKKNVEFIVLAGYMRLIGPTLLNSFRGKIINIHPSYLPDFPGKDAIGQAIAAQAKETGVTIHYVDEGMDTGPIIAQERISISNEETKETLTGKIQQVEHRLYPYVIQKVLSKDLKGVNS